MIMFSFSCSYIGRGIDDEEWQKMLRKSDSLYARDISAGYEYCMDLLENAVRYSNGKVEAYCRGRLYNHYFNQGDYERAYHEKLLQYNILQEQKDSQADYAMMNSQLSQCALFLGDYRLSYSYAKRLFDVKQPDGNLLNRRFATMSKVLYAMDSLDAAEKYAKAGLKDVDFLKSGQNNALYEILAEIYVKRGLPDIAAEYVKKIVLFYESIAREHSRSIAVAAAPFLLSYAEYLISKGRMEDAIYYLEEVAASEFPQVLIRPSYGVRGLNNIYSRMRSHKILDSVYVSRKEYEKAYENKQKEILFIGYYNEVEQMILGSETLSMSKESENNINHLKLEIHSVKSTRNTLFIIMLFLVIVIPVVVSLFKDAKYGKLSDKYDDIAEKLKISEEKKSEMSSEIVRLKKEVSAYRNLEADNEAIFRNMEKYMKNNCVYSSELPEKLLETMKSVFGVAEKEIVEMFYPYGRYASDFEGLLKEMRLEEASVLLLEEDAKIEDVYRKLNFPSRQAFYRVFKNKYGIPPSDFRQMKKKK